MVDVQKSFQNESEAKLYLVPTPIGNLDDITYRALSTLQEVSYIACEDTRQTKKLLNHFDIHKPLISYHEHSNRQKEDELMSKLRNGDSIALVSDAGMPVVSDPGFGLIQRAREEHIDVVSLPGANAALVALVASGLPANTFTFYGFLPKKKKEITEILSSLDQIKQTVIFYESPYRIKQTVEVMAEYYQTDREIVLARELTKKFEEYVRGTVHDVKNFIDQGEATLKGEFVLLVGPGDESSVEDSWWESLSLVDHVETYIQKGISSKDAIKQTAIDRAISKREVYQAYHVGDS
ncbi:MULTISPECIES: 16S rRNA (cytidine(1402)-2'-O)-methyltransferase [Allobacillus]|uniref:Ribosomal RNA small subunit methyltransferase I n=1 Tax=Allobacillus salarius TaxID=1955272 RepID=A0A556PBN1_9BACI|nr:16S rRNA (cytidine(1402)-2'-O)-methyltransferase [Allobacillus salarius]TSJ61793.1 16S rRNA (cytidine(1402)-2'-O)-methyltransferase [Allobacillus salarius]